MGSVETRPLALRDADAGDSADADLQFIPMYGAIIAFKNYNPLLGILYSPWVGWAHFQEFISSSSFTTLLNTFKLSAYGLLLGFPPPIILAMSLNQIMNKEIQQKLQLILYAPNFISVVIIVGMLVREWPD